jgi:hypothetical protein
MLARGSVAVDLTAAGRFVATIRIASRANASINGEAKTEITLSIAWVKASMPVAATRLSGRA